MVRVGVRELKQNASAVLRRVKAGESVEVTERGEPVALIVPLPVGDPLDRMVAEGRARVPEAPFGELSLPPRARTARSLPSVELARTRDDER